MADLYTVTSLDSAAYTNTANWVGGAAPSAADDIFLQYDASQSLDGSDQSATELGDINVLPTCTGNAGTADTYLQLDQATTAKTTFAGLGTWYIDLGDSGSSLLRVEQTRSASGGKSALYLKNDTNPITLIDVASGNVRLVNANATDLVVRNGATVTLDTDTTIGTIYNEGGTIIDHGASVTAWEHRLGTSTIGGSNSATMDLYGGTVNHDGTGTLTAEQYGGTLNSARDNRSKSLTLTHSGGNAIIGPNVTLTLTLNSVTTLSA